MSDILIVFLSPRDEYDEVLQLGVFCLGFLLRSSMANIFLSTGLAAAFAVVVGFIRAIYKSRKVRHSKKITKYERAGAAFGSLTAVQHSAPTNRMIQVGAVLKFIFNVTGDRVQLLGIGVSLLNDSAGVAVHIPWVGLIVLIGGHLVLSALSSESSVSGNATTPNEIGNMPYGFCLASMWFRILLFLLVQRELGQFVRVMISMGHDLGFFGIVWGLLCLAFSCAMLGSGLTKADSDSPMRQWSSWWIVRTYLQSLGHDNLDDMTSHTSNLIFVIMWPVFNVL